MKKNFVVQYRPRGYQFARLESIFVKADDKKEARQEALMRIGDCYCIVKVTEAKKEPAFCW